MEHIKLIKDLFDPSSELAGKVRAAVTALLVVATTLLLFLQAALDVLHVLPDSEVVAYISAWIIGLIQLLTRFTAYGNKPA